MIHPITKVGDDILQKKAQRVAPDELSNLAPLIPDMIETMRHAKGIGIAAPQIGKSIQLIVVERKDDPLVLVNPRITFSSRNIEEDEEGCLSVPGIFGMVPRSKKIRVKAMTPEGKIVSLKTKGLLARILQHEIDHLNGTLIIDRITQYIKRDGPKK